MEATTMSDWEKQKDQMKDFCKVWDKAKSKEANGDKKVVKNQAYCTLKESFDNTLLQYKSDWERILKASVPAFSEDGDGQILNEVRKKKVGKKATSKTKAKKSKKSPYDLLNPDAFNYVKPSIEDADADDTSLTVKVKKLANLPNKVDSDSYGRDGVGKSGRTKVSAGWTDDPNMKKLVDLKQKLYDLEREMSVPNGLDEIKTKKNEKKFNKLHDEIAKLSDKFVGDYKTNQYYV
jgi:hypothetical protein